MEEMELDEGAMVEQSVKRYSKYFDLTATDFVKRVIRSFIPIRPLLGYEEEEDNHKPDLYGPLWIPTTLVISLSVGHSLYIFFLSLFNAVPLELEAKGLNFRNFWISACIIYGYCVFVPLSLYIFRCCSSVEVPFFATVCVYGYAMAPIVVSSLVCIVPIRVVQWSAMGAGFFISTMFMFYNVWREQTITSRSLAYFVKLCSGILHVGIGLVLTFLFFWD